MLPCRLAAQTPIGTPSSTPMMMPIVAISSVAGKTRGEVVDDRLAGRDRSAEIARAAHVADIGGELDDQRPVEAHLDRDAAS